MGGAVTTDVKVEEKEDELEGAAGLVLGGTTTAAGARPRKMMGTGTGLRGLTRGTMPAGGGRGSCDCGARVGVELMVVGGGCFSVGCCCGALVVGGSGLSVAGGAASVVAVVAGLSDTLAAAGVDEAGGAADGVDDAAAVVSVAAALVDAVSAAGCEVAAATVAVEVAESLPLTSPPTALPRSLTTPSSRPLIRTIVADYNNNSNNNAESKRRRTKKGRLQQSCQTSVRREQQAQQHLFSVEKNWQRQREEGYGDDDMVTSSQEGGRPLYRQQGTAAKNTQLLHFGPATAGPTLEKGGGGEAAAAPHCITAADARTHTRWLSQTRAGTR